MKECLSVSPVLQGLFVKQVESRSHAQPITIVTKINSLTVCCALTELTLTRVLWN